MLATQARGELEGYPSGSVVEYAADDKVRERGSPLQCLGGRWSAAAAGCFAGLPCCHCAAAAWSSTLPVTRLASARLRLSGRRLVSQAVRAPMAWQNVHPLLLLLLLLLCRAAPSLPSPP